MRGQVIRHDGFFKWYAPWLNDFNMTMVLQNALQVLFSDRDDFREWFSINYRTIHATCHEGNHHRHLTLLSAMITKVLILDIGLLEHQAAINNVRNTSSNYT